MKKENTPNIFKLDYLLNEVVDLLNNEPESAPRLMENLMNADYDMNKKTGYYKLLNEEQRALFQKINLKRKTNPEFNEKFQAVVLIATGIAGLGYGAVKLIEKLDK